MAYNGGGEYETTNNLQIQQVLRISYLTCSREKDNIIREQAEEIGQLRERISVMERRRGVDASDVPNSGIASVG